MDTVTVVIPTFNRRGLLSECLDSVFRQDYPELEVIVIDDGSTDDTVSLLKTRYPEVTVITNSLSMGPAYGKNQGIMAGRGTFLHFLDSDSELISDTTISTMVGIMKQHSDIGILGGIAQLDGKGVVQSAFGKEVTFDGRSYPVFVDRSDEDFAPDRLVDCRYVETCNCFVRSEALERVGGFDPWYVYMGEDKEFGLNVTGLGYRCCFSVETSCLHKFDRTVKFNRAYMYLRTKMHFMLKNRGLRYALLTPLLDSYFFLVYFPFLFLIRHVVPSARKSYVFRNRVSPNTKPPSAAWLFLAPWFFLKAYFWNYSRMGRIVRSRGTNFLTEENMNAYRDSIGRHAA